MEPISTSTGTMISISNGTAFSLTTTIRIMAPEMYTAITREHVTTATGVVFTTPPLSGALTPGVSVTVTGVGYTRTVSAGYVCTLHLRPTAPSKRLFTKVRGDIPSYRYPDWGLCHPSVRTCSFMCTQKCSNYSTTPRGSYRRSLKKSTRSGRTRVEAPGTVTLRHMGVIYHDKTSFLYW